MSSLRGLLDFRHREFATFMKARGSLVDTPSTCAIPLPATRPSSPDPTPYNYSSASLSSPATSSQCKSSACRPSEKTSPNLAPHSFAHKHSHTLPSLPLPPVNSRTQLPPLSNFSQTRNSNLPPALQCILNPPVQSNQPQSYGLPSLIVGNTSSYLSTENPAMRKRPRTDFASSPSLVPTKIRKIDHSNAHLGATPHVSPTTITNLVCSDSAKLASCVVRPANTDLAQRDIYGHQLCQDSKIESDPSARLGLYSNTHGSSTRRQSSSEGEEGDENGGTLSFDCELCASRFLRKHHLERHIQNIHEGQRPWTCDQCGFSFHQKPNLERHIMTVHEDQKPFRCNVCDMAFGRKGVLKKHVQMVHEHSRKFECEICFIPFGLKSDLKRHVQSVHQKKRPFVCEVCSASFGRRSDLKRHTLSLHPGVEIPSQRPGLSNNKVGAAGARVGSSNELKAVSGPHHPNVGNTVRYGPVQSGSMKQTSMAMVMNGLRHGSDIGIDNGGRLKHGYSKRQ